MHGTAWYCILDFICSCVECRRFLSTLVVFVCLCRVFSRHFHSSFARRAGVRVRVRVRVTDGVTNGRNGRAAARYVLFCITTAQCTYEDVALRMHMSLFLVCMCRYSLLAYVEFLRTWWISFRLRTCTLTFHRADFHSCHYCRDAHPPLARIQPTEGKAHRSLCLFSRVFVCLCRVFTHMYPPAP